MADMSAPEPYLHFPGTARQALTLYQEIFGGELTLNTFGEFGRDDGPAEAIVHGMLRGPVSLFAADTAGDEEPFRSTGLISRSSARPRPRLRTGSKPWPRGTYPRRAGVAAVGRHDGQVVDRHGVHWLVGFEEAENE